MILVDTLVALLGLSLFFPLHQRVTYTARYHVLHVSALLIEKIIPLMFHLFKHLSRLIQSLLNHLLIILILMPIILNKLFNLFQVLCLLHRGYVALQLREIGLQRAKQLSLYFLE